MLNPCPFPATLVSEALSVGGSLTVLFIYANVRAECGGERLQELVGRWAQQAALTLSGFFGKLKGRPELLPFFGVIPGAAGRLQSHQLI